MRGNPSKVRALEQEVDTLQTTLDDAYDRIEECLDPALSREQIVAKLQELSDELAPEEEEGETSGEE
jgi:hypothetical protein